MDYTTEAGNVTKVDASISAKAAPAFVEKAMALAHGTVDYFSDNNSTLRFSQEGDFTAEIVAESSAYTLDAGDEYVETDTDVTAQTYVHIYAPTVQAERFSKDRINPSKLGPKQAGALARKLDETWANLFTGFTGNTAIDMGSVATLDGILDGQVAVHKATKQDTRLHYVFSRDQRTDILKEVKDANAAAFGSEIFLQGLWRKPEPNGLVGEYRDVLFFNKSGLPTSGGDTIGLLFDPEYAFAFGIDPTIYTRSVFKGSTALATEIASWMFANVAEWIDTCGVQMKVDTPA